MGDYVSVIVYIICAIALLNLLFLIAKEIVMYWKKRRCEE